MFTSMLQKHHHFWLLETQSTADCALPWQPAPMREGDLCSARHGVVVAAGTRQGRWSSSCKRQGRSGQRGHHPELRRGKQLVQREHEELEDHVARGPHRGLTPGSATCPVPPAHQAEQGQQQRGHGLGGHQSLSSHSHHDAQGAASPCMQPGMRGCCPGMPTGMSRTETYLAGKSCVKGLQPPFMPESRSVSAETC